MSNQELTEMDTSCSTKPISAEKKAILEDLDEALVGVTDGYPSVTVTTTTQPIQVREVHHHHYGSGWGFSNYSLWGPYWYPHTTVVHNHFGDDKKEKEKKDEKQTSPGWLFLLAIPLFVGAYVFTTDPLFRYWWFNVRGMMKLAKKECEPNSEIVKKYSDWQSRFVPRTRTTLLLKTLTFVASIATCVSGYYQHDSFFYSVVGTMAFGAGLFANYLLRDTRREKRLFVELRGEIYKELTPQIL